MLLDPSLPEHRGLVLTKAKEVYDKHWRAAAASGEEYEDFTQRLLLSLIEEPVEATTAEVWSRALTTFWRAPAKILVSNGRGNQLTIRFMYDYWKRCAFRLEWTTFHELMAESEPWPAPQPKAETLPAIQYATQRLEQIYGDPTRSPSSRAAAKSLLEGCMVASTAELFGISRQSANQAKQKLLQTIREELNTKDIC